MDLTWKIRKERPKIIFLTRFLHINTHKIRHSRKVSCNFQEFPKTCGCHGYLAFSAWFMHVQGCVVIEKEAPAPSLLGCQISWPHSKVQKMAKIVGTIISTQRNRTLWANLRFEWHEYHVAMATHLSSWQQQRRNLPSLTLK